MAMFSTWQTCYQLGRCWVYAVVVMVLHLCAGPVVMLAYAVPGAPDLYRMRHQTCSTGCVASIMVACAIIAILASGMVCCCAWYSPELKTRAKRRKAAQHEVDRRTRVMNEEMNAKQAEYERTHEDMCTRIRREQDEAVHAEGVESKDGDSKTDYSHSKTKSGKAEDKIREEDDTKKKATEAEAAKEKGTAAPETGKEANENFEKLKQEKKRQATDAKNKAKAQEYVDQKATAAGDNESNKNTQ